MKAEIKSLSLGCRLNTLETEKIRQMLVAAGVRGAVVVNTCSVTAEAERQSKQAVRRLIRENPGAKFFVTGCAATRDADAFAAMPCDMCVVHNKDKMDAASYGIEGLEFRLESLDGMSKGLVQIQNGCNHACTYCVVASLRGKNVSRPCEQILADARALVDNGYGEIVLTGVDIAGFRQPCSTLSDLCKSLLNDLPNLQRLRLSSLDPGVDLRPVLDIMRRDARMLPHMHLSMQSGCDTVLSRMGRRHNADMVRQITGSKISDPYVTFSWDMIFGFPGETEEEFAETLALIRELKPIRLHAFPFSPRPGTPAATMPNPVPRAESKRRVKIATDLARENMREFMESQIGKKSQVLVEQDNIGRDAHDIPVMIFPTQDFASDKSPTKPIPPRKRGGKIPDKSIVNVKLIGIADRKELTFIATI